MMEDHPGGRPDDTSVAVFFVPQAGGIMEWNMWNYGLEHDFDPRYCPFFSLYDPNYWGA